MIYGAEPVEDRPGALLWRVGNSWQRRVRAALAPLGLTHVQFVLLAGLARLARPGAEGPVTQARLARLCQVDPMMASQVLRTLERRGLLGRAAHATDTRARSLSLTERGVRVLENASPLVVAVDAAFFTTLGADRPAFTAALARLVGVKARVRVPTR